LTPPSVPHSKRLAGRRYTMGDQNACSCDRVVVITKAQEGLLSVATVIEDSGSSGWPGWFTRGMASGREFAAPR